MNEQLPLIVESLNESIRYTVSMLGGPKKVGSRLWPGKDEEQARKYLDDCLNPERAAKLSPEEVLAIARWGREERNSHLILGFLCADLGYAPPLPIDPQDERAELMRQYIESTRENKRIADRMERLAR